MLIEWFPTFLYFSEWHQFKTNDVILDFGSNRGNLIHSSRGVIAEKNYVAIDVDAEALNAGQCLFPHATWIHYNRYNPVYNKNGDNSFPQLSTPCDIAFSYSVFSHTTVDDLLQLVDWVMSQLPPSGKFYFSWCNIDYQPCVEWFRQRRSHCDEIPLANYCYLVDNKASFSAKQQPNKHFVCFLNKEFLTRLLIKYRIQFFPPPAGWVQHCACVSMQ